MAWIQIEDEQARLERAWRQSLNTLPEPLRLAERTLLARIDLGRGKAASWPRLFAPWTSLYPLLQAEGLGGANLHQATRLNVAHLSLLVHAFADDRARDGQIDLNQAESAFSELCFSLGMDQLKEELPEVFPGHPDVKELLARYPTAQQAVWPGRAVSVLRGATDDDPRVIHEIAGGRAVHGYLAPLALGISAGATPDELDRMRRAYDLLVTGLQWGDDLEDWKSDWRTGRQNLLLSQLPARESTSRDATVDEGELRLVGRELHRRGILSRGLDEAGRCFDRAADLQASLGCLTLAEFLRMLNLKVDRLRSELEFSEPA